MKCSLRATAIAVGLTALAGCTTDSARTDAAAAAMSGESISIAVGPCFGFCPVYRTTVTSAGSVIYTGERHTEFVGERRREAGVAVFSSLSADLAAYRPADGATQQVECDAAITDTSIYTITWRRADGIEAIATHQSRCSGGPGQKLDTVLSTLPQRLGITAWAKQVTRPGVSRG